MLQYTVFSYGINSYVNYRSFPTAGIISVRVSSVFVSIMSPAIVSLTRQRGLAGTLVSSRGNLGQRRIKFLPHHQPSVITQHCIAAATALSPPRSSRSTSAKKTWLENPLLHNLLLWLKRPQLFVHFQEDIFDETVWYILFYSNKLLI